MQRLTSVRWLSPPPTSVDEELATYDDGSVWLVIRSSRDGTAVIGTWSTIPSPDDHAALVTTGDLLVELPGAQDVPAVAEKVRHAALSSPVATARFFAALGDTGTVTLAALGSGSRPVQFEVEPAAFTVHLESGGATTAWFEASPPTTGFITPDATGLGGLGRRAQIDPGAFGALVLQVPGLVAVDGDSVAVQVSGWLAEGLPDQQLPLPFKVRTTPEANG